ncbi:peptide-methionine (R)-S-oxide reductase MsrB [Devosia sp.]|uniref:peptide-methionine (R)-S-oxide reductase MsrB n=1 Tax=Devosia sp. TaxID=1871048 RepID=UPI003A92818D
MALNRRKLLLGSTAVLSLGVAATLFRPMTTGTIAAEGDFEVTLTEAEWRSRLSPEAFNVLREEGTEFPGTSDLLHEKREGIYACAGCDQPLFDSATKYDSRTGWPSFYEPLTNAVGESTDYKLGYGRTEVHCSRCGGHLGHVFNDGPEPTGLRYCMNGVAMTFEPASA